MSIAARMHALLAEAPAVLIPHEPQEGDEALYKTLEKAKAMLSQSHQAAMKAEKALAGSDAQVAAAQATAALWQALRKVMDEVDAVDARLEVASKRKAWKTK